MQPHPNDRTPADRPLVIVGCGFTGLAAAAQARAAGRRVVGTTRDRTRSAELAQAGIEPLHLAGDDASLAALSRELPGADCLITYPPDPEQDAQLSQLLPAARARCYVSSTAVYGKQRGRIDDDTPIAPDSARGHRRATAEERFRKAQAVVLRAPGIYGPGRGVHRRLLAGTFRLVDGGSHHLSRIHVQDLAGLCLQALACGEPEAAHVVGDLTPTTQLELVDHLCELLQLPLPPSIPAAEAHETLRGDRQVDPSRALKRLDYELRFPDYRRGYRDVLEREPPRAPA